MTDKPETVEDVIAEMREAMETERENDYAAVPETTYLAQLDLLQSALERERAAWSAEYNKAISEGKIAGYLGSVDLAAIRRVAEFLDGFVDDRTRECAAELRRACGEKP